MSKVIFKMTFKHPNLKDTTRKNVGHVKYIATRPGTDKTVTEADLKKELEKGIETLSSDDQTYIKYINERPRSHGLFGQNGIENLKEVQKELSKIKSFVWRGIVSLRENDAKKLGYLDKEQWQNMLRKKIPDIANEMKIKITNLRWCGAIHMEKGHPHAHIMLWEKEPEKKIGIVSPKTLSKIRKILADEIFEEERFQLINEKNIMRDLIRDLAKNDISKAAKLIKEIRASGQELKVFIDGMNQEGVTPKLYSKQEQEIARKIKDLSEKLPGKGRIALKFMPEDVKEEARAIANYIIKQPEFTAALEKNLKAVEELTKIYTNKDKTIQKARNNAFKDIRDRISQIILKGAVESKKYNIFYVDQELSQKAVNFIKNINNKIKFYEDAKNIDSVADTIKKTIKNLSITLLVSGIDLENTKKIINQWNIKSNSNIDLEKLNNIIDKAYKTVSENNLWSKTTVISTGNWKEMFKHLGVEEKDMPKWIYKGENWKSFNYNIGLSVVNDIWKSAWRELEKQRMQSEVQAEYMKKQINKHQAVSQNKEAMKEQIRKNKDRNSMYRDEEEIER